MLDVVGKRGWYFLISAVIILPGLVSMMTPPGWLSWDSGLKAGIDFSSGSVMNVTFRQPVEEAHIGERMDEVLVLSFGDNQRLRQRGAQQLEPSH